MFTLSGDKCFCGAPTEGGKLCGQCSGATMGVGRVLLSLVFIYAGYGKLVGFAATAGMIGGAGYPMPEVLTVLAIVFELGGGLLLLAGKLTKVATLGLAIFTVLATLMFHLGGPMWQVQFLKNLAIIGGLLYTMAAGPGAWALDTKKHVEM